MNDYSWCLDFSKHFIEEQVKEDSFERIFKTFPPYLQENKEKTREAFDNYLSEEVERIKNDFLNKYEEEL